MESGATIPKPTFIGVCAVRVDRNMVSGQWSFSVNKYKFGQIQQVLVLRLVSSVVTAAAA